MFRLHLKQKSRINIIFLIMYTVLSSICIASEDGDPRTFTAQASTSGGTTSGINPPTKDVFVANSGSGLDTGCTFNTDANHPLEIEVVIDKFVGDVDENGYLLDPTPLIAQGIIPATVSVTLPAFDVDVNGNPPPEKNELFLNNESLGFLTGDNQIWKLNLFNVDIGKIKFPARPVKDQKPTPVSNQIKLEIDTLSSGRWCTAIDWVAIEIPIRPKFALELEVIDGHEIVERDFGSNATIDRTIYEETFEADCTVKASEKEYKEFPFAGSASTDVQLNVKINTCPEQSVDELDVEAEWKIPNGAIKNESWKEFEHTIKVKTPADINQYSVDFTVTINEEETKNVSRKLFVTNTKPKTNNPPKLNWYEKATEWGAGQSGDKGEILQRLLNSQYLYGTLNWKYGYDLGEKRTCGWKELVDDQSTCKHSDCFTFGDVYTQMAKTLGITGIKWEKTKGSEEKGFLTIQGLSSFDSQFTGNARPLGETIVDRYNFFEHITRKHNSIIYDPVFNRQENNFDYLVAFNDSGIAGEDGFGEYELTVEGVKVYKRSKGYGDWGVFDYIIPTVSAATQVLEQNTAVEETTDLAFTSDVIFKAFDLNNNGLFDGVTAEFKVNVLTSGRYTIHGELKKEGEIISAQSEYHDGIKTQKTIDVEAGLHTIILKFSGENIFESRQDGPYYLELSALGGISSRATLQTPVYQYQDFGEFPIQVVNVIDKGVDIDNDGLLDGIRLNVNLLNRGQVEDEYFISVYGEKTLTKLSPGGNTLEFLIPGQPFKRANQDGPYEMLITVDDIRGKNIAQFSFVTQSYVAKEFTTVIESITIQSDQGIDTTGNGLFNSLQVTLDASFNYQGALEASATLSDISGKATSSTKLINVSSTDPVPLVFDFNGTVINRAQMDGPYRIEISVSDPITHKTLDRVPQLNGETSTYNYSNFDTTNERPKDIEVEGSSSQGVDNNGNDLFDQLHVTLDLKLAHSGTYEWSASLFDSNGIELGFYNRRAFLNAGKNSINLLFDGYKIGENGKDGPYAVKGFLIFGAGASLVRSQVATTLPFHANEFEGFIFDNTPPEINITLSQSLLWPPNHRMQDVEVNVTVTDDQDSAPKIKLLSVTSNEVDNGSGDGDTTDDIIINHDYSFSLRAERAGNGSDRVYTITYQAEDASGNIATKDAQVIVPHD